MAGDLNPLQNSIAHLRGRDPTKLITLWLL